jgi:hypothetical protein
MHLWASYQTMHRSRTWNSSRIGVPIPFTRSSHVSKLALSSMTRRTGSLNFEESAWIDNRHSVRQRDVASRRYSFSAFDITVGKYVTSCNQHYRHLLSAAGVVRMLTATCRRMVPEESSILCPAKAGSYDYSSTSIIM